MEYLKVEAVIGKELGQKHVGSSKYPKNYGGSRDY